MVNINQSTKMSHTNKMLTKHECCTATCDTVPQTPPKVSSQIASKESLIIETEKNIITSLELKKIT